MKLKEYLDKYHLTVTEFSKIINYTRTHISEVVNEYRMPGKKCAYYIEQATNGEVTADELLHNKKV